MHNVHCMRCDAMHMHMHMHMHMDMVCAHSPRDGIATYSLPEHTQREGAVVPQP